ncbi:MAG: glycosyltransferase family 2 protein [Clostridia bacterium]|nr:glycosyltransferase family 2 protein [Clostridia bacterium]
MQEKTPIFYLVIPCYNEEQVLPVTAPLFRAKLEALIADGRIHADSRVLYVDDGSKDGTWDVIRSLAAEDEHAEGMSLSRNRGHQNALLAGLMTAKERADVTVSIDCDGQDDLNAVEDMLTEYEAGCDVVYGVRSDRRTDTFFKRGTAQAFYKLLSAMGVESVYNHADYRLLSRRALEGLAQFEEVNLFLRGMVPLVGYRTGVVYYERAQRLAGNSHYPLRKMLALAIDGITSLSVKPLKLIAGLGLVVFAASLLLIVWCLVRHFTDATVSGWSSLMCVVLFLGGVQLLCVGVLGEYVGKIYAEVKRRPRYIVKETTFEEESK